METSQNLDLLVTLTTYMKSPWSVPRWSKPLDSTISNFSSTIIYLSCLPFNVASNWGSQSSHVSFNIRIPFGVIAESKMESFFCGRIFMRVPIFSASLPCSAKCLHKQLFSLRLCKATLGAWWPCRAFLQCHKRTRDCFQFSLHLMWRWHMENHFARS